ncbi:LytTR family DNA-binding domain-containing protein [Flavobacterium lindanitolerans]|uniref:LytTR family DNA-binding domain-containing protein n=1 Tax=Flavobacterium lindanitolerans TaxID=428988 RepID=UPI0023F33431|nr:LytTR family DNA-binding domain-containing protein [Flavobacterium lindanitolerans]
METVSYNNTKVRIVSAAIGSIYIVFHGIPVDLIRAFSSPGFYLAVAVSFAISFLLVSIVHGFTVWLDRRCPWRERPFERGGLQLIFGVMVPAIVDLLLVSVYFEALGQSIVENGFLLIDFPVIICLIIFLNLYYLIHYLLLTEREFMKSGSYSIPEADRPDESSLPATATGSGPTFNIHYNGQHLFFNVANDILFFHREGKMVKGMTVHGAQYPIRETISNLEKRFLSEGLFRINRSTIINYRMVEGYVAGTKRDTAKLIIKPIYLPYIQDPNGPIFHVTKDFLASFRSALEELSFNR